MTSDKKSCNLRLYDITKELFSSGVYPGDPVPEKESFLSLEKNDVCNLTKISMGSHNGTHLDAPLHFVSGGKDVEGIPLEKTVGSCIVISPKKVLDLEILEELLKKGEKRILIRGDIEITTKAADLFCRYDLFLLGVENQTVGKDESQITIHQKMLGKEIVILEGLVLDNVKDGKYLLAAQPLKMKGLDGSPVRAILMEQS